MNFLNLNISILLFYSFNVAAANMDAALPTNAVKVTKENSSNCVEYYTYKKQMYCSSMSINNQPIDPQLLSYEKQDIQFDNRVWKAVWGEHTKAITSIEYVPAGQNINHWNELITSQFIPGMEDVSAKEFANRFLADLKKSGLTYKSYFIDKQPKAVIIEFQIKQPKNLQQDEIQKIVKGSDGIYVVHYVIKQQSMSPKNRQKWSTHLKNSTLKN